MFSESQDLLCRVLRSEGQRSDLRALVIRYADLVQSESRKADFQRLADEAQVGVHEVDNSRQDKSSQGSLSDTVFSHRLTLGPSSYLVKGTAVPRLPC